MVNQNDFYPNKVLKVYKQEHENRSYIEVHDIKQDKDENYVEGPGVPLTRKVMKRIIGATYSSEENSLFINRFIDPRILSFSHLDYKRYIIWYDPAGIREMKFTKRHNMKDGSYHMPAFLYFVTLGEIRIFAMKTGSRRPKLNTKLYKAPLCNAISDYALCWGSVKIETDGVTEIDKEINLWDGYMWNTLFSHEGQSVVDKVQLHDVYKHVKDGAHKFPAKHLIDTKMTINDLMDKYLT